MLYIENRIEFNEKPMTIIWIDYHTHKHTYMRSNTHTCACVMVEWESLLVCEFYLKFMEKYRGSCLYWCSHIIVWGSSSVGNFIYIQSVMRCGCALSWNWKKGFMNLETIAYVGICVYMRHVTDAKDKL